MDTAHYSGSERNGRGGDARGRHAAPARARLGAEAGADGAAGARPRTMTADQPNMPSW